ncbi:MAG TPA: hypothetical protein VFY26_20775 [Anaerolineales bacterium]|nr:hypothetical protein [Anaerolineales bacterium]
MNQYSFTIVDVAAILYGLLAIIVLLAAFRFLRWLFRKVGEVWTQASLFGADPKTRLVSLGIAALLFPRAVFSLANAIIYFIGNFFVSAPRQLLDNWINAQFSCSEGSTEGLRYCFGQLWFGFIQSWTEALSNSIDRFGPAYLPYNQLVLMLAVWAVVAVLLSEGPADEGDSRPEAFKLRLQSAIDGLGRTARLNIMFFLVLVLAGYLSIAAIAAIPGLQEPAVASEAVSVENLEDQLESSMTDSLATMTSQELPGTNNPFASLTEAKRQEIDADILEYFLYLESERRLLLSAYPKLLREAQSQAKTARDEAVDAYRVSLVDRKGSQETAEHYLAIGSWYRRILNDIEYSLDNCRSSLQAADQWYEYVISQTQPEEALQIVNDGSWADNARTACDSNWDLAGLPDRPDLGGDLGPFSFVARWLLQTESLPLAQIVGMLGFGLLGSAVSTLVRSETKRRRNQPLVEELATVVIRGATAAIVVFLAVKGGLAIFTSGESDPNSYVLLLTCLVAAVFSEDVWQEARVRLNSGLSGEGEQEERQPARPEEAQVEPEELPSTDEPETGSSPVPAGD